MRSGVLDISSSGVKKTISSGKVEILIKIQMDLTLKKYYKYDLLHLSIEKNIIIFE